MKAVTKIMFLDDSGEKFFGEGPAQLLRGVEKTGSLRAAAMSMQMAYTKALKLIRNAENALQFPLILRSTGGKDGGGSQLTAQGLVWLQRYEAYRDACKQANEKLYWEHFPEQTQKVGCVIMASGLGTRFGGNKLMAHFHGKPMILQALQASESLKDHRVVVTRHADVAQLCRELGVAVIEHTEPHRSDTVRLGLEALGDLDGCLFLPGDQPLLRRQTVDSLVSQWRKDRQKILRPFCGDTPGAPVLFPKWCFPELLQLPQGKGGGWLIRQYPDRVQGMQVDDPYELMDADTPQTLLLLQQHKA